MDFVGLSQHVHNMTQFLFPINYIICAAALIEKKSHDYRLASDDLVLKDIISLHNFRLCV